MQRDRHMDDHYSDDDSYYARFEQLDPHSPLEEEERAKDAHDRMLAHRDRLYEMGDGTLPFRHANRHDRQDRREAKDERRARALLRPQSGQVEVQPIRPPLHKAA